MYVQVCQLYMCIYNVILVVSLYMCVRVCTTDCLTTKH